VSAAPQSPQKSSPGSLLAPHLAQAIANFEPQPLQNRRPARLSTPHLEQRIGSPIDKAFGTHLSPDTDRDQRAVQRCAASVSSSYLASTKKAIIALP